MSHRDRRRVCVRGIIYKNGKLFCQELKNKDGSGKGFWCTPGGGVDPLEPLTDALVRELIEETGVRPQVGRLLFIQQFADSKNFSYNEDEQLEFFFHIKNPDDYETIDRSASHYEAEIADCDFVDPKTAHVLPAFLGDIDIQDYIDNEKTPYLYVELNRKKT